MDDGISQCFCFLFLGALGLLAFYAYRRNQKNKQQESKVESSYRSTQTETGKSAARAEEKVEKKQKTAKVYEILLPAGVKLEIRKTEILVERVLDTLEGRAMFRIEAKAGRMVWQVVDIHDSWSDTNVVVQSIQTIYPDSEVVVSDYTPPKAVGRVYAYSASV